MATRTGNRGSGGPRGRDHDMPEFEAPPEGTAAKFDPQEIAFLEPREGHPMSPELAQAKIVDLRVKKKRNGETRALFEHDMGTGLRVLYGGIAEVPKGHPSFAALVKAELGYERQRTWAFIELATLATEEQAKAYGIERLRLAIQLCNKLELQSITALERHDLETELGEVVRAPATVAELQSALAKLESQEDAQVSDRLKRRLKSSNRALKEERKNEKSLRGVRMVFVAHNKKQKLRVSTPLDEEQIFALQRVLARLEQKGVLKRD